MNEKCISCRKPTVYEKETHIQNRIGYIQGVGQLCKFCYETIYNKGKEITIPEMVIELSKEKSES